ncbi:unnamed protein product [Durusdinium trenchii]|uniref:EIF-4F 25 kDa subunit n=2 Tax=Durusdinium trenchii TaxID=1381693 RepID=A0ABP0M579_9DINO
MLLFVTHRDSISCSPRPAHSSRRFNVRPPRSWGLVTDLRSSPVKKPPPTAHTAEVMAEGESPKEEPEDELSAAKHELQHRWCLWVHQRPGSQKDKAWNESQREAHSFDTVEDFWCMFHFSYPPSKLENVDYSLFKQGIAPAWEDAALKNGGRWVIKLEKVKAQSLDDLWLSLSLALIGEAFYDVGGAELVCGAIVSVRSRASKIALWLTTAKDEKRVMAIGREYRNVLASTPGLQELATKEFTFEDFRKQSVTYVLSKVSGEEPPAPSSASLFQ